MNKKIIITMLVLILLAQFISAENIATKFVKAAARDILGKQLNPPNYADAPIFNSPESTEYETSSPQESLTLQQTYIPLVEGWNLISLPLSPYSNEVEDVFSSIEGKYDVIYTMVNTVNGYEIKDYNPHKPAFLNTLHQVDETMGLWVYMNQDATLTYSGYAIISTNFDLREGWNFIGYPSLTSNNIESAFPELINNGFAIATYDESMQDWIDYNTAKPDFLNTLTSLSSKKGYWIYIFDNNARFYFSSSTYHLDEIDNNLELGTQSIIYGPNGIVASKTNNELNYYHQDSFGNVRRITNDNGEVIWQQDYAPYGNQIQASGNNNSYKFTDQEYEYDTDYYNLKARLYNPELSRFLNPDPIITTQSPFSYSNNNPLGYSDPSGLSPSLDDWSNTPIYTRSEPILVGSDGSLYLGNAQYILYQDEYNGFVRNMPNLDAYMPRVDEEKAKELWPYKFVSSSPISNLAINPATMLLSMAFYEAAHTTGTLAGNIVGPIIDTSLRINNKLNSLIDPFYNLKTNTGCFGGYCLQNIGFKLSLFPNKLSGSAYASDPINFEIGKAVTTFDFNTKEFSSSTTKNWGTSYNGISIELSPDGESFLVSIGVKTPSGFTTGVTKEIDVSNWENKK